MFWQLLKKELHLQRSGLFFTLAVVMVWGVLMGLTPQAEQILIARQLTMGQLISLMQSFFVGPCLLCLVPLFAGATLVAEERKLGVWDWHLSLPGSRRWQWALKLVLAAAIVLALSLVVMPALDRALYLAMDGRGDPFPPLTEYLHRNGAFVYLPLLLMAAGAYASSLAADPYKAFFGGLAIFVGMLGVMRLIDPAGLLMKQWNRGDEKIQLLLMTRDLGPALLVGLSAGLAAAAWMNFRFEPWRWRRLQLAGLVLFTGAATALALRGGFSPRRTIAPWPTHVVLGQGIQPLLMPIPSDIPSTPTANGITPPREERPLFGRLYLMNDRILAEVNRFPMGWINKKDKEIVFPDTPQIVEYDLTRGRMRSIDSLKGCIDKVLPDRSAYTVLDDSTRYLVTQWPVPIKVVGLLFPLWMRGKPAVDITDGPLFGYGGFFDRDIIVDEEQVRARYLNPVNAPLGYYQLIEPKRAALVQRRADGHWRWISKPVMDSAYYVMSADGRWYAQRPDLGITFSDRPRLQINSSDNITSWTINAKGMQLLLSVNQNERWLPAAQPLGGQIPRRLWVSPDSRFLAFMRFKTIKIDVKGQPHDTGYPARYDFSVLDLKNGMEQPLWSAPPESTLLTQFGEEMENWLYGEWLNTTSISMPQPIYRGMPRYIRNFEQWRFPVMVWAPEGNTLAILHDRRVRLFEYRPDVASQWQSQYDMPQLATWALNEEELRKVFGSGAFLPAGVKDLAGYDVDNMDFLDKRTLLAWGNGGLFRIDLDKATQMHKSANLKTPKS